MHVRGLERGSGGGEGPPYKLPTTRMATSSQGSQKDCSEMAKRIKKKGQPYAEGTSMN